MKKARRGGKREGAREEKERREGEGRRRKKKASIDRLPSAAVLTGAYKHFSYY